MNQTDTKKILRYWENLDDKGKKQIFLCSLNLMHSGHINDYYLMLLGFADEFDKFYPEGGMINNERTYKNEM